MHHFLMKGRLWDIASFSIGGMFFVWISWKKSLHAYLKQNYCYQIKFDFLMFIICHLPNSEWDLLLLTVVCGDTFYTKMLCLGDVACQRLCYGIEFSGWALYEYPCKIFDRQSVWLHLSLLMFKMSASNTYNNPESYLLLVQL